MKPDLTPEVRHDTSALPDPPKSPSAWPGARSVSAFQIVAGDIGTSRAACADWMLETAPKAFQNDRSAVFKAGASVFEFTS